MIETKYYKQVDLLLQIIPLVKKFECFALKGGTALNFFVHDAPRLSVDIDLVYVPLKNRDESLAEISESLKQLKDRIEKQFLLSLKKGEPEWSLLPVTHINKFPSIQWKLHNIKKLDKQKHLEQLKKLGVVLK